MVLVCMMTFLVILAAHLNWSTVSVTVNTPACNGLGLVVTVEIPACNGLSVHDDMLGCPCRKFGLVHSERNDEKGLLAMVLAWS